MNQDQELNAVRTTEPCPCGDPRGYCKVGMAHACTHPLSHPERILPSGERDLSYPDLPLQGGLRVDGTHGTYNLEYIEYWKRRALKAEAKT